MTRPVTPMIPGEDADPNPDDSLAMRAGAMTAAAFLEDLKRGFVPYSQAAERMRADMALWQPVSDGTATSAYFRALGEFFQAGYINEFARRCA